VQGSAAWVGLAAGGGWPAALARYTWAPLVVAICIGTVRRQGRSRDTRGL